MRPAWARATQLARGRNVRCSALRSASVGTGAAQREMQWWGGSASRPEKLCTSARAVAGAPGSVGAGADSQGLRANARRRTLLDVVGLPVHRAVGQPLCQRLRHGSRTHERESGARDAAQASTSTWCNRRRKSAHASKRRVHRKRISYERRPAARSLAESTRCAPKRAVSPTHLHVDDEDAVGGLAALADV